MAFVSTQHWSSYADGTIANIARVEDMIATSLVYAGEKNRQFILQKKS